MDKLRKYLSGGRGRATQLASVLEISAPAISQWERVPSERVLDVEAATGVSRHDLRPDLYPREREVA